MARAAVMAAGGIVMQRSEAPLIAVVRLRKGNHWVLPKGKLNNGETARAAAEREVVEETGRDVSVHEFLGTLAYEASGGRPKIVHFWRMEAEGEQTRELMADVKAVAWLPLDKAVKRLTRDHEQAFLANVGPLALETGAARTDPASHSASKPATAGTLIEREAVTIERPAPKQPAVSARPSDTRDLVVMPMPPRAPRRSMLQQVWDWLRRNA